MAITAAMVKQLRDTSGAGTMDAKKALTETDGDMDAAIETRPQIFLLPGRDKRVGRGHPWVYSNEVKIDAEAKSLPRGTTVTLLRVDGKPLDVASFNPHALICARLYDRDPRAIIDREFIAKRLRLRRAD